jgi:hypothetical protein
MTTTDGSLVELANDLYQAGRYADARRQLDGVLVQRPGDVRALFGRALSSIGLGDVVAAEADLERVLEIKPDHAGAHYRLGELAERRGDTDQAVWHYQETMLSLPDHHAARRHLRDLGVRAVDLEQSLPGGTATAANRQRPSSAHSETPQPTPYQVPSGWLHGVAKNPARGIVDEPVKLRWFGGALEGKMERMAVQTLSFLLVQEDKPPVAVHIKGETVTGLLAEGHRVAVPDTKYRGAIYADRVLDLETGERIIADRRSELPRNLYVLAEVLVSGLIGIPILVWVLAHVFGSMIASAM